jgi:flagellar biosynthesis/type III secretory pathway protein FliH
MSLLIPGCGRGGEKRREGGKERRREGGKEGRREGGKERRREGEKEGRREGVDRVGNVHTIHTVKIKFLTPSCQLPF